jgi:heme-degrading monooxygenase HmoA
MHGLEVKIYGRGTLMRDQPATTWKYLIGWEFRVKPGLTAQFESLYGPKGVWAELFARSEGYVATELTRDHAEPGRYITLDFWTSREAYEEFRRQHLDEYQAIDSRCEELTESEVELGCFERLDS